jgi:hypothetical protein
MCSIGHDLEDAPRQPRRHLDDTARRAVAKTPRKALEQTRAAKTAQLRAEIEASEADALAAQHGVHGDQLELVPLDMAQLPPSRFRSRAMLRPEDLWYSSAREA